MSKLFPPRNFRYQSSGGALGHSGTITAGTANEAASMVLGRPALGCGGSRYSQPWRFVSDPSGYECSIWEGQEAAV